MWSSTKWIMVVLVAACSFEGPEPELETGATRQALNTVTTIHVNGRFAFALLHEGDETNGFLNASKDQLTNTSALDFSYVEPHPTDPNILVFQQGAGPIPNASFSINGQAAGLHVTTPFTVTRCEVDRDTAEVMGCADGAPITFDLSWTNDQFGDIQEKTKRKETFGPVTTKFEGELKNRTATIDGTWTGHTAVGLSGNLLQTVNTTITREITLQVP